MATVLTKKGPQGAKGKRIVFKKSQGHPNPVAARKRVPGNSMAGTETAKRSANGWAQGPVPKKEVKKAVKKTATAAKKTVKRAVAAVKKVVKKSARAGGGRAAEAGRKSWYT